MSDSLILSPRSGNGSPSFSSQIRRSPAARTVRGSPPGTCSQPLPRFSPTAGSPRSRVSPRKRGYTQDIRNYTCNTPPFQALARSIEEAKNSSRGSPRAGATRIRRKVKLPLNKNKVSKNASNHRASPQVKYKQLSIRELARKHGDPLAANQHSTSTRKQHRSIPGATFSYRRAASAIPRAARLPGSRFLQKLF